jgi:hypothetical protein
MISEKFFEKEFDSNKELLKHACDVFVEWFSDSDPEDETQYYPEYIDGYAAFESILISNNYEFPIFEITNDKVKDITKIQELVYKIKKEVDYSINNSILEKSRAKYRRKINLGFYYEFSDGDLSRLQNLINELRDNIVKSELFTANHKERILKRLEKLQAELHKKVSDLDKFWGLVGDAGVVLGKFGKDAKPFVDRIKEITQIIWSTQTRAEELPSGTNLPLLDKNE